MSSSSQNRAGALRRRAILALLPTALLGGCGFEPLYGEHRRSDVDVELAAVKVSPARERIGQLLVLSLRDSLNPGNLQVEPKYSLQVAITTSVGDFAIRNDGTASRELYNAVAVFYLRTSDNPNPVFTGVARANDSYDVGESPYTTIVATTDADKKAAASMSREILLQVTAYMRRHLAKS